MKKPSAKTIRIGILLLILAIAGLQYLRVWRNENWVPDWEAREMVAVVVLVPKDLSEGETELLEAIKRFAFADEGKATFTALTYWFEREHKRYSDRELFSPVHFEVIGPLGVDTLPPPPPRTTDELTFSERYERSQAFLAYYAAQREREPFKPKNAVFVSFYHASQSSLFKGVHSVADRRSRSGFVFAPLTQKGVEDGIINVAHELLHLFGASDKYEGDRCVYPEGFYAPLQEPRYPQTYAEVMAQAIPVESGQREAELELFADMRVGVETAYEIGWIEQTRRDAYYEGDASAGPREVADDTTPKGDDSDPLADVSPSPENRKPPNEAELLVRAGRSGANQLADRLAAVKVWHELRLDRAPGARERMFTALGSPIEAPARLVLIKSLTDTPPAPNEALAALRRTELPESIRRTLIAPLAKTGEADPSGVALALAELPDTSDLLALETLVRLGFPPDGAARRLVENRGAEWAVSRPGRAVLASFPDDPSQLEPLLTSPKSELRVLACELLVPSEDAKVALKLLVPLLEDDEPTVRQAVADTLATRADPRATYFLALALGRDPDARLKETLTKGLADFPRLDTVRYLKKLFLKKSTERRMAAILGARALMSVEVVPIFHKATRAKEKEIVLAGLAGLEAMSKDSELKPALAPTLRVIAHLAQNSKYKEIQRSAKRVHYAITGRMP